MISLPIYPRMSDGDVADVIEAVIEVAKKVTVRPAYV
jgi:dTDP-4-amino-4,6-dideoxygalactose transaminase